MCSASKCNAAKKHSASKNFILFMWVMAWACHTRKRVVLVPCSEGEKQVVVVPGDLVGTVKNLIGAK